MSYDPHAEGLIMAAFAVICAIVMLIFAAIGIWTVIGWIF